MFHMSLEHPTKDIWDPYTETSNVASINFFVEKEDPNHLQGVCNDYETALLATDILKELGFPLYEEPEEPEDEEVEQWIAFETSEDGDGYYINAHGISQDQIKQTMKTLETKLRKKQWQLK